MRTDARLLDVPVQPFELTERRRRNQELNIAEYRDRAVRLESRPLALFVELTQNCNLSCPMCRYGESFRKDWNMPEELYDRLADELFPYVHLVDIRGWGESTLLPRFGEHVARALSHRVKLRLVTNGQINRPPIWDMMMRAHGLVTISVDAADPELFTRLRGGGTVEKLERTVRELVSARDRHGAPRDNLSFNTVSSLDNLHDLADVVTLAARWDVPTVVIHPMVAALDDPSHLRHDLDRTQEAYAAAAERGLQEGVVVQLGAAPDPALAIPDMVRRPACMHPWSYAYVRYDGGVGFCDHLLGDDTYTLGNLRDNTFEEIWNGEAWQDLRRAHTSGDIPDRFSPCRYTFAQRYVDFEHLVHPDRAAGLVSNRTHRQVTFRRDSAVAPSVPWTPPADEGASQPDAVIPVDAMIGRLRDDRD